MVCREEELVGGKFAMVWEGGFGEREVFLVIHGCENYAGMVSLYFF